MSKNLPHFGSWNTVVFKQTNGFKKDVLFSNIYSNRLQFKNTAVHMVTDVTQSGFIPGRIM